MKNIVIILPDMTTSAFKSLIVYYHPLKGPEGRKGDMGGTGPAGQKGSDGGIGVILYNILP